MSRQHLWELSHSSSLPYFQNSVTVPRESRLLKSFCSTLTTLTVTIFVSVQFQYQTIPEIRLLLLPLAYYSNSRCTTVVRRLYTLVSKRNGTKTVDSFDPLSQ